MEYEKIDPIEVIKTMYDKKTVKGLLDVVASDRHKFSTRPCGTCQFVTSVTGFNFGCVELASKSNKME